jgi:hypothetical protein
MLSPAIEEPLDMISYVCSGLVLARCTGLNLNRKMGFYFLEEGGKPQDMES